MPAATRRNTLDRTQMLEAMAAHVLAHGLGTASLRPLAKAAGTSDRMLLYHFKTKDGLIADLLDHLAGQMEAAFEAGFQGERAQTRGECLTRLAAIMRSPMLAPMLRVWADILAGATAGREAFREAGQRIADRLTLWLVDHLPEGTAEPEAVATEMIAMVEGIGVLDMIGRADMGDLALRRLAATLDAA